MEITIQVPTDIAELIADTGKSIYLEAVKQVAASRLNKISKRISELDEELTVFEKKHNAKFVDFQRNMPDTFDAHNDWQEWDYLTSVRQQYQEKYNKLRLIL